MRHVERSCDVACGHPVGAATNQQAKRFEAGFLRKGSKAARSDIDFHISRLFDILLDGKRKWMKKIEIRNKPSMKAQKAPMSESRRFSAIVGPRTGALLRVRNVRLDDA